MKEQFYQITKGIKFNHFIFSVLLLNICFFQNIKAQVFTVYNGSSIIPETGAFNSSRSIDNIDSIIMPEINIDSLINLPIDENIPYKFGHDIDVKFNLENSGSWDTVSEGRIWKLKIISQNAFSINLIFDKFILPDSASLYIYNEERTMIYGPVTSLNCGNSGVFASDLLKGDAIILEYFEPYYVFNQGIIEISKVIHAYNNMFSEYTSPDDAYGTSGDCNIDIRCPEGDNWCSEARSVALILLDNNTVLCSGAMINNVNKDFTPFFLTANHCLPLGGTDGFRFHYKNPYCDAETYAGVYVTYIGASLKANSTVSDFALLALNTYNANDNITKLMGIHFAGWTRDIIISSPVTCIHHPAGDVMKISMDNTVPTLVNIYGSPHWYVDTWDLGSTTGGSSGSPLFNKEHHIIGQDHAGDGYNECDPEKGTYFGSFHASWNNGLGAWLDPGTTLTQSVNTISPPVIFHNQTVTDAPLLWTATNQMELAGNISGYPTWPPNWLETFWFFPVNNQPFTVEPGANLTCKAGDRIVIKPGVHIKAGANFHAFIAPVTCSDGPLDYQIYKYIENENNNNSIDTINNQILSNNAISIFPNPSDGNMQISYEIPETETGTFEVYNMMGEKLFSYSLYSGKNTFSISHSELNQGIYFYRAIARNRQIASDKIVIIK